MYQGRTLAALAQEIDRQRQAKRDFIATTGDQVRVIARPVMVADRPEVARLFAEIDTQGSFALGPVAHGQLSNYHGIPKKYYDRMLAETPELLATNINTWMEKAPARRMIRTLDGTARAYLSDKYRVIDNDDVLGAVLPVLGEAGLTSDNVLSSQVTDRRLYLKAVFPRITGEVSKGDPVQAGIVISNSELGLGRVSVEALIYRLVCLNGMIAGSLISKYHVGRAYVGGDGDAEEYFRDDTLQAIDAAFMRQLRDTIAHAASQTGFDNTLQRFRAAKDQKIADPIAAVEEIKRRYTLTDAIKTGVLTHLIEGADLSRWGLANAITRASQDAPDYDTATDLERLGGTIIDLAPGDWRTIGEAKKAA